MAMQALTLSIVACETNVDEIRSLIQGCQLGDIGGTANTKYRDYAAEDILEILNDEGVNVQRAQHCGDDGASMLEIIMFVPDERKDDVKKFIEGFHESDITAEWGVSVGDSVEVPEPDNDGDMWNFAHQGSVIGFRGVFAQVEDGENDVWDIEPKRLTVAE